MGRFNKQFYNDIKKWENDDGNPSNSTDDVSEDNLTDKTYAGSDKTVVMDKENIQQEIPFEEYRLNSNGVDSYETPYEPANDLYNEEYEERKFCKIPVKSIEFAEDNPFRRYDNTEEGKNKLKELAMNIATFGLIHPLLVNKIGNRYILISGERRLLAVRMLEWEEVDCIVISVNNANREKGMLYSANTYIRAIKPFEMFGYIYRLSEIYKSLLENEEIKGGKHKFIADSLSMSKRQVVKYTHIMNHLKDLSDEELNSLEIGELSVNKAYNIIKDREDSNSKLGDLITQEPDDYNSDDSKNGISDSKSDEAIEIIDDSEETENKEEHISEEILPKEEENIIVEEPEVETDIDNVSEDTSNTDSSRDKGRYEKTKTNDNFVEVLFNPKIEKDIQLYEGVSVVTNRKIFGLLSFSGEKAYITFPSKIYSDLDDKIEDGNHTKKINFVAYEVFIESIKHRGE